MRASKLVALAVVLQASGCIVEAPGGSDSQQPGQGPAATARPLAPVPPLDLRIGANFEDKIELVGARIEPGRAYPGEMVKVTTFYKVNEPVPQDYMIFVHVEDPDGRQQRVNYDHAPMGGARPTSDWKKGETVSDTFTVQVPGGAGLRGLNVWLGFWHPATDTRLRLSNPQQVRNDGSNRILLGMIPVAQ